MEPEEVSVIVSLRVKLQGQPFDDVLNDIEGAIKAHLNQEIAPATAKVVMVRDVESIMNEWKHVIWNVPYF